MDPLAGANVVFADKLAALPVEQRAARRAEIAGELAASTAVRGPAGIMKVDEIIDPLTDGAGAARCDRRPVCVAFVH